MNSVNAMTLKELLQDVTQAVTMDVCVSGLQLDSRQVVGGDLFVALPGMREQGHQYIAAAIDAGAVAVLVDASLSDELGDVAVPCLAVPDLKQKLGVIAERFYDFPSQQMFVVGITGTNGKTSCSHFIAQVLSSETMPVALIGTLGNGLVGQLQSATHTTPDAISLHRLMREFVDTGAKCLVMEVSSHGLDQGRVNGVSFDLAVFTNLTRDHLDYHCDMDAYGRAKARLFQLPGLRYAVINGDDEFGRHLLQNLPAAVESLAFTQAEDCSEANVVRGELLSQGRDGLLLAVQTPWGDGRIHSELLGQFNASNLLAVLATVLLHGMGMTKALQKISQLRTVPGRVERFGGVAEQPLVVVDYAHTPDALEQVLLSLRQHCAAQLWCVFGCG
ncbi:MAG TPA: UDP-N-acetylmuramoyl-L-alanyl-D-glutamate--2,6-diaminopimelate ligase, partial [Candidatus Tenderia electrophaga]|nr:UDP-N-acetylmuramoyl-L-alanyl-D-glutamate--2,6-diaminopimelate ligase [Candidatus Tenderia electrophaga]